MKMKCIDGKGNGILAVLFSLLILLSVQPVASGWAGDKGKSGKPVKNEKHYHDKGHNNTYRESSSGPAVDVRMNVYFNDQQRNTVHNYYREEYRSGHCPPGLAKKKNGCMPPGQAKKWRIGHPLPHDVVTYDLPATVIRQLGPPPAGHRYVRVASDILMIAVGTGMIVDAIDDLNQL